MTDKQQRFVDEYLIDLNATQAAIRAGYSENRASELGYQLLQKPTVQGSIQKAMKQREERTKVTQNQVVEELAKIAFSNITDYLEFGTTFRIKESSEIDGSPIQEVSISKDGACKFKLHNKLVALELLAKHLGMFENRWFDNDDNQLHITIVRAGDEE